MRLVLLSDPDFMDKGQPVEVSEVYIDTAHADKILLERFITFILHSPPENGVNAVKIFHRGELDKLGNNLRNALQNNFEYIDMREE